MRFRTLFAAALAAFVPALAIVQGLVASPDAQGALPVFGAPSEAGARRDPANITALSPFMEQCLRGNVLYASRDFPAAIEAYRKAIQIQTSHPLGHYLLGEAQLATGNLVEADASFQQAERLSANAQAFLRGRVLFVLSDVKERQKKWEEARVAWLAYVDFATKNSDAGTFQASGESRLAVLDKAMKQDKDYELVRQRMKDTADGGVFTEMDASPPQKDASGR